MLYKRCRRSRSSTFNPSLALGAWVIEDAARAIPAHPTLRSRAAPSGSLDVQHGVVGKPRGVTGARTAAWRAAAGREAEGASGGRVRAAMIACLA